MLQQYAYKYTPIIKIYIYLNIIAIASKCRYVMLHLHKSNWYNYKNI